MAHATSPRSRLSCYGNTVEGTRRSSLHEIQSRCHCTYRLTRFWHGFFFVLFFFVLFFSCFEFSNVRARNEYGRFPLALEHGQSVAVHGSSHLMGGRQFFPRHPSAYRTFGRVPRHLERDVDARSQARFARAVAPRRCGPNQWRPPRLVRV